jgi:phosphoserine phosphatase
MKPALLSLRAFVALAALLVVQLAWAQSDPLPAWNDGPAKQRIVDFVRTVTTEGGKGYVPPAERIAVFDNDGTLWPEQPMYVQLAFALDRVDALAPEHGDWKRKQPFRAALSRDMRTLAESGEKGIVQLLMATHAGMTTEEFRRIVRDWLATAKHPRYGRPYTELAYAPMLELMAYLRANGFKTYIVSGGGIEFMRVFAEQVYGVPPEQIVGSTIETKYDVRRGEPVLMRLPEIDFIDDGPGKPVGIDKFIGRRPIAAFGNSDGDFQMLEYVTAGEGPRLAMIVHHDDAEREYAYDRKSPFGKLDRALDAAGKRGWTVVSMKNDWRQVFRTPQ